MSDVVHVTMNLGGATPQTPCSLVGCGARVAGRLQFGFKEQGYRCG